MFVCFSSTLPFFVGKKLQVVLTIPPHQYLCRWFYLMLVELSTVFFSHKNVNSILNVGSSTYSGWFHLWRHYLFSISSFLYFPPICAYRISSNKKGQYQSFKLQVVLNVNFILNVDSSTYSRWFHLRRHYLFSISSFLYFPPIAWCLQDIVIQDYITG